MTTPGVSATPRSDRSTTGENGAIRPFYFNEVDEGNHFAAWQEPEVFTAELRAGFRALR